MIQISKKKLKKLVAASRYQQVLFKDKKNFPVKPNNNHHNNFQLLHKSACIFVYLVFI